MFRAASVRFRMVLFKWVPIVCGFAWFFLFYILFYIKWVPTATFRHFSGCGFAMAWAQNLLGFCLFARASQTPFSWVWSGGLQASKSYVAQRFALLEATFFCVFSRFQKQLFALSLFGIFRRFHKQRFGSFLAAVSHGLGIYISFFLMGSNSDVSAFFRLRFRNGLGTKPAGVLPFRMRVPNTFFLSLAWWLAGFFFVFSRVQKQRFGSFLAAVSHGLGPISFSF